MPTLPTGWSGSTGFDGSTIVSSGRRKKRTAIPAVRSGIPVCAQFGTRVV